MRCPHTKYTAGNHNTRKNSFGQDLRSGLGWISNMGYGDSDVVVVVVHTHRPPTAKRLSHPSPRIPPASAARVAALCRCEQRLSNVKAGHRRRIRRQVMQRASVTAMSFVIRYKSRSASGSSSSSNSGSLRSKVINRFVPMLDTVVGGFVDSTDEDGC